MDGSGQGFKIEGMIPDKKHRDAPHRGCGAGEKRKGSGIPRIEAAGQARSAKAAGYPA